MKRVKKNNKKKFFDSTEREENIRNRDKYQQKIKLFFEEKKVIEDEIKNIGLVIREKEVELKKINEKKYLYNIERDKIEKEEKISILLDKRREAEKKRWELEKKITDIVDIESEIGEVIFEKKTRLKEINAQHNLLKEKILKMEENLALINNKIKYIGKEELDKEEEIKRWKKEETRDDSVNVKITKKEPPVPILLIEKQGREIETEKDKIKDSNQKTSFTILTKKEEKDRLEKINSFFELFYNKIWLTVVTFNNDEKKAFKRIILSGGADFIPGMAEYMQKQINQKLPDVIVKIADPFINIDDSNLLKRPKKISQFSNAIGAALKGFKN